MEVLSRYGYADIGGIKTGRLENGGKTISKVEIVLKKTSEFEKIYESFEKEVQAKRGSEQRKPSAKKESPPKEKPQQAEEPQREEEVKESSPKKADELLLQEAGSTEAATSAKSQSTPEKAAQESAAQEMEASGKPEKTLKKDKWWLKGVTTEELTHLQVDDEDEPLIYM